MRLSLFAAAAMLSASLVARADTLSTFNVSETLLAGSAAGTITIDTTTGTILGANYTVSYLGTDYAFANGSMLIAPPVQAIESTDADAMNFLTFSGSTLVNFGGSQLCSISFQTPCNSYISAFEIGSVQDDAVSGSLTFASSVSTTPEPSSIALLGTGMLGIVGVVRKRFA